MKKIFVLLLTLCMVMALFNLTTLAADVSETDVPADGTVIRVRALKKDGTPVVIADSQSFEQGWETAIDLAKNGKAMDAGNYVRVIVDLLADWKANKEGEFGDSDLDGFRQSTIHCPSNVKLTINMNGHTIDRDLKVQEYDGEVIFIDDKANVIINGGNGDIKEGEAATDGMIGTIKGGWSCNGAGGIHIADDAEVILNNIHVVGNAVEDDKGAGIAVYEGSSLVMNGGSISNNRLYAYFDTFERTEGALYVDEATVVLNDVIISGNYADDGEVMGVAVSLNSNCKVTLNRCHVLENSSKDKQYLHSVFYLDDDGCELEINDSYILGNGRPTYSMERRTRAALAVSNGKMTLNKCEIRENKTYMMVHSAEYSAINNFNECVITDNPFSVIGDFTGDSFFVNAEHTFTKCKFNNNHSPEDGWCSFSGTGYAKITLIDCDMGDSTYENKEYIDFVDTDAKNGPGSIFGEGSLAIVVAFVALVVSIASIAVNVSLKKNKSASTQTEQNK